MFNKNISIAIDGPAGAGKSTIAKKIAEELCIEYIDTGAMYRALTLKVLQLQLNPKDENDVIAAIQNTNVDFRNNDIYLDDINVEKQIRENIINNNVSFVAKVKEVRDAMVSRQRELSKMKSIIMDGRDIGSVVLPNAEFKFFITATVDERANRRYKELIGKGETDISFEQIRQEIEDRDKIDMTRDIAPLIQTKDACKIDTTNMTINECVEKIISIIRGGN